MQKRSLAIVVLLMFVIVSAVSAAEADVSYTLDCRGFSSNGGSLLLNRDNTGAMQEAYVISAVDGSGATIYEPDYDVFFVGTSVQFDAGMRHSWTNSPFYNPLTLQIVSPAGNGLDEEVILQVQGACASLPTFSPIDLMEAFGREALRKLTGEAFVVQPSDGETDIANPLNTNPPRPINPPGLPEEQSGWAVVNTDNLSLRSGDSVRYELIGVVDGGTSLIVLGRNEDRSWWYVQVGGMRGWVSGQFIVTRGDLTDTPVVPVMGGFARPRLYVGYAGNPIYALPLAGSAVACTTSGNRDYEIVGRTSNAAWYEIVATCNDELTTGWIPAEFGVFRNPGGVHVPVTYP